MRINSSQNIFHQYSSKKNSTPPPQDKEVKLPNNALAHLSVDNLSLERLNGDKMEEAMSGLRSITQSLKEILNRNLKASNEDIPHKNEHNKNQQISKIYNYDNLASKSAALLA